MTAKVRRKELRAKLRRGQRAQVCDGDCGVIRGNREAPVAPAGSADPVLLDSITKMKNMVAEIGEMKRFGASRYFLLRWEDGDSEERSRS